MSNKKKILLVYDMFSTFVEQDYAILASKYTVKKNRFHHTRNPFLFLWQFINQFFILLFSGWKYDVIFVWFVDYHSFLPLLFAKLSNRNSVVIVGGYDAVSIPEIKFGSFYKENIRTKITRISYKMAKVILPVDETLIKSTNDYVNINGNKVGFLNFVGNINGYIEVVPTGYNPDVWKKRKTLSKRDIITVGGCNDWKTFQRKGHDLFLETARLMPDTKFTLVGLGDRLMKHISDTKPTNVEIVGFVDQYKLIEMFSAHKVFAQFSMSEGLPNTLCEAMLCGCIPVASSVNGIPKAVGDTGYILKEKNSTKAVELINLALACEVNDRPRNRIIELFHIDNRKSSIYKIIES